MSGVALNLRSRVSGDWSDLCGVASLWRGESVGWEREPIFGVAVSGEGVVVGAGVCDEGLGGVVVAVEADAGALAVECAQ